MAGYMLEKDAVLSKISIIKNCLNTINRVTGFKPEKLDDFIKHDVFVLYLQRAIQACIDISNIIIAKKGYKLPASYKESFVILEQNKFLEKDLADKIISMVDFRNMAVLDYREISIDILQSILLNNMKDFEKFYSLIYSKIDELLD
jgi:uncharacterized protein YutE (UPF0331/DUF86 family)